MYLSEKYQYVFRSVVLSFLTFPNVKKGSLIHEMLATVTSFAAIRIDVII